MKKVLLSCCVILFSWNISKAATFYMPDDCSDLHSCAALMSGGDDLIIRDGVYSGNTNVFTDSTVMPPNGSVDKYTEIRAEHIGGAVFPDSFLQMINTADAAYIKFDGLKSLDWTQCYEVDHFLFKNCAFEYEPSPEVSTVAPLWVSHSHNCLVEDCWAWGAGRYRFVASHGDHTIFRRCVARFDRTDWTDPMGNFCSYDNDYTVFQNCIAIDSDHPEFWLNTQEVAGNFYIHHGAEFNEVVGSVGVNNRNYFIGGSPGQGLVVRNNASINTGPGIYLRADSGLQAGYDIVNCNILLTHQNMYTNGDGVHSTQGDAHSVSLVNTVLYGVEDVAAYGNLGGPATYGNVFYNNGTDHSGSDPVPSDYCAANSNAIDPLSGTPGNGVPGILYPVRIEDGSDLDGTGHEGADRGASVLYRVGIDGTFYGDQGWDTVTSNPLWPWPNEDRIRSDMKAYTYTGDTTDGTTETLSGDRGFCVDGETLTHYIWNYLGNGCPDEICGYDGGALGTGTGLIGAGTGAFQRR